MEVKQMETVKLIANPDILAQLDADGCDSRTVSEISAETTASAIGRNMLEMPLSS